MYFISYKCVVGEVGSYFQLAVTFFFGLTYQTRDNVVPQFIFDPPFSVSLDPPLLFDIASAREVPFGILQYVQCILCGLTSVLLCVPFIFANSENVFIWW